MIVNGSVRAKIDDEVVELGQWDAVRVDNEQMRGFEAARTVRSSRFRSSEHRRFTRGGRGDDAGVVD